MNNLPYNEDSSSVQAHLGILQNIIQRMASNSSSMKTSCITLVSAILVIIADKGKPQYALIAFIPCILFSILDSYYLALERGFRDSYKDFIEKVHTNNLRADDLFEVKPKGSIFKITISSLFSFSIWPFYSLLIVMILIAKIIILPNNGFLNLANIIKSIFNN